MKCSCTQRMLKQGLQGQKYQKDIQTSPFPIGRLSAQNLALLRSKLPSIRDGQLTSQELSQAHRLTTMTNLD